MDSTNYEQLSGFIDGNLESGAGQLTGRLVDDERLSAIWRRYHFIGDCLRREGPLVDAHFTDELLQRIADEPTVLAPAIRHGPENSDPSWTRWAAGAAIAASVAAIVLIGVVPMEAPVEELAQPRTPATAVSPAVAARGDDEQTRWDVRQPEVASKLNRYLANHSDFASRGSLNGMTPLAMFVSYDE